MTTRHVTHRVVGKAVKAGWRTSEFWAMVAANVGLVASALDDALPPRYAALGSAISVAAYAVSRGLAKS